MNEDDLLRIGTESNNFLESESFVSIIRHLRDDAYEQFLQSKPEEKQKRQDLYMFNGAIDAFVGSMQQLAATAENIRTAQQNETEE